jgi:hypothetical protein
MARMSGPLDTTLATLTGTTYRRAHDGLGRASAMTL